MGSEALAIRIAPAAGGRIASIACEGVEWLRGHDQDDAAIGWGSYPMLPWAGRLRQGRFRFGGRDYRLTPNLGALAIHGLGFMLPWRIEQHTASRVELSLRLPEDDRWPFGGTARHSFAVDGRQLRQLLSLTAGSLPMPAPVLGWHPWFRKPDRLEFAPTHHYPRDAKGIATAPVPGVPPRPWDDCFINTQPVLLHREGQSLQLASDCNHWVVYDERADSTCVEPQGGPPDAFNLNAGRRLEPGGSVAAWFELHWL